MKAISLALPIALVTAPLWAATQDVNVTNSSVPVTGNVSVSGVVDLVGRTNSGYPVNDAAANSKLDALNTALKQALFDDPNTPSKAKLDKVVNVLGTWAAAYGPADPNNPAAGTAQSVARSYLSIEAQKAAANTAPPDPNNPVPTTGATTFPDDMSAIVQALAGGDGIAQTIQKLANVLGDPSHLKPDPNTQPNFVKRFGDLKTQVANWIDPNQNPLQPGTSPLFDSSITDPTSPGSGSQAFNTTLDGLLAYNNGSGTPPTGPTTIGTTFAINPTQPQSYVDANGNSNQGTRDPSQYVGVVGELAGIKTYYTIRSAALNRRQALQGLLQDTLDDIQNAPDFATVAKETALIEIIENQIKACTDEINTAFNDLAVRSLSAFAMNQIQSNADAEVAKAAVAQKMQSLKNAQADPSSIPGLVADVAQGPSTLTPQASGSLESLLPWKSK